MHNNESLVITIIGAGFSGTMVAVNLLKRATRPLVIKIIEPKKPEGLIRPHPLNLGLDVASNGALINATEQSEQLYTLGSPQIGYLWETIAVPEVRGQAEALAIELLK